MTFPSVPYKIVNNYYLLVYWVYNEYKMSPTSISGGGNLLTGGELISPASCDAKLVPEGKGQEEALSIDKAGTMAL